MLSRRSGTASYSCACSRNASGFSSDSCAPPASFISARRAASTSCPASSPARSQESSDLRNHSSRPQMMAREAEGDRHAGDPRRQLEQDHQHGAVDRVPGQDVAELVADHPAELLRVVQVDHAGGDHDERLVPAQRHRVHQRVLGDVDLGHLGQVQDVGAVPDQLVDVRELALGDLDRARQVRKPEGPLVEQAEQLAQKRVEPGELAQRDQRRTVGGMLVGAGRDAGEPDPRAIWH